MGAQPVEFEGTWEEIAEHGTALAGRRVRLVVLADDEPAGLGSADPPAATTECGSGLAPRPAVAEATAIPFTDVNAWLDTLPAVPTEEADALWQAVAENRTMRRSLPVREQE